MIDEFIQYMLTPFLAIVLQVILVYVNYYFCKNESKLRIPKVILFTIEGLIAFSSIWVIVNQVVIVFTLGGISLCLFFLQIIMNIEFILEEY